MVDHAKAGRRARRLEIAPREKRLVLLGRMPGEEAEGGAEPERHPAGGGRRREDEPAGVGEKRSRPDEDASRFRKVLEEGEEEDDVERPAVADLARSLLRLDVPEDETRLRMTAAVFLENLAAPVAAEIRPGPSGKGRQAAADVEETRAVRDEGPDGGEPPLDEGACQEAVETIRRSHEPLFSTDG